MTDDAGVMNEVRLPTVGVSMGDPGGIGPEVVVQALAGDGALRASARFVVYGSRLAMDGAAQACGVEPFWWTVARGSEVTGAAANRGVVLIDRDGETGPETGAWRREPTRDGGAASFAYVEDALADAAASVGVGGGAGVGAGLGLDAVVTAPISKEAWALAGRKKWAGHTELVSSRLGAKRTRMMFVSPRFRVALCTTHIPLMRVGDELTLGRVLETIELCHETLVMLGEARPRIAVAGLNPHAGEGGLMGVDEERVIVPAVKHAVRNGLDVTGPFPGDTVFRDAMRSEDGSKSGRRFDAVVAMYHDQGLIPVKLLDFERAVNLTAGLPVPRTSPDHGTAFGIAGRGVADERSMGAALRLGVRLAKVGSAAGVGAE